METRLHFLERAIIVIVVVLFLAWSVVFIYQSSVVAIDGRRYFCLFDDAMISMRYAWNLAHGAGLAWNPGQRVEGYTNLLMTLLMALVALFLDKSTAVLAIQILGVLFVLASAYVTLRIVDLVCTDTPQAPRRLARTLAFTCTLLYYPLAYWSLMGMETGILTLLVLLGILGVLRYTRTRRLSSLLGGAGCLGLAFLTRPDAGIFGFLALAFLALEIHQGRQWKRAWPHLAAASALVALFVGGQTLFRLLYYGEAVPNTYVLKLLGIPLGPRLSNGLAFIGPFLQSSAPLLILALVDLAWRFRRPKLLFFVSALAMVGYQVWAGGDAWPYWRIMVPVVPLLLALFIPAAAALGQALLGVPWPRLPQQPLGRAIVGLVAVFLTLGSLYLADQAFLPEFTLARPPYLTEYSSITVDTGIALEQLTTARATVGVIWAGAIPYYSGREAIDFLGKSDPYIAHLPADFSGSVPGYGMTSVPGHNKYDLEYSIKQLRPTYVQAFVWGLQDLTAWSQSHYVTVPYHGLALFLLKDSPDVRWDKIAAPSPPSQAVITSSCQPALATSPKSPW